jgi:hypothetical protein
VFVPGGIGAAPWVVIHKPSGDHRPEPFAHVTLFEAAAPSDCFTTRSRHVCHVVEEPYPVAQRSHRQRAPSFRAPTERFSKATARE